jgi:hypothetical protein
MSFVKKVMRGVDGGRDRQFISSANHGAGDEIKDPSALAFYHTEAKFKKTKGQPILFPRASSLFNACLRMHAIACKSKKTYYRTDYQSPDSLMIFDIGSAVHYLIQNTPAFFGDRRIGRWVCSACGEFLYFGLPPKNNCPKCGALPAAILYQEHGFKPIVPFYCSGHVDLFLNIQGGLPRILDAKTMGEDEFYKLKAPVAKDEIQLVTYMILAEKDTTIPMKIDTHNAFVFYVCKRTKRDSLPYKMFRIRRTPALEESVKSRLSVFRSGMENFPKNIPEPQKVCLGNQPFDTYTAKSCPCLSECRNLYEQSRRGK